MRTNLVSSDVLLKNSSLDFGVPISKTAKTKITKKLEALKERLPMNSSIDLSFNHQDQKLRGYLKIRTLTHTFSSIQNGSSPISTFEQLENEINKQILNWKKSRFKNELLRNKGGANNFNYCTGGM